MLPNQSSELRVLTPVLWMSAGSSGSIARIAVIVWTDSAGVVNLVECGAGDSAFMQQRQLPGPPLHDEEVAQAGGVEEGFAFRNSATHLHRCEVGAGRVL